MNTKNMEAKESKVPETAEPISEVYARWVWTVTCCLDGSHTGGSGEWNQRSRRKRLRPSTTAEYRFAKLGLFSMYASRKETTSPLVG